MDTTINVKLEVKEIIFDIQNKAFLTGQAREAGGVNYEAASNMQVWLSLPSSQKPRIRWSAALW